MKKLIVLFLMLLSVTLFWYCSENEVADVVEMDTEECSIYYENLQDGVSSVEVTNNSNPLFQRAISSLDDYEGCLKSGDELTFSNEVAIYTYEDGQKATIFMTEDEKYVYFQLIDANTEEEIEFVKVSIEHNGSEEVSVLFQSLITDFNYLYNSESSNKSWGSCMRDAMSSLYDDWDNDPAGTFACWVSGPACAIGGGIACAFI